MLTHRWRVEGIYTEIEESIKQVKGYENLKTIGG